MNTKVKVELVNLKHIKDIPDQAFYKLSLVTLRKMDNVFGNCTRSEISDYIFSVLYDAEQRKEIVDADIFRLGFKFLNQYLNKVK